MRGKGRCAFFNRNFHGITPAYAGKSAGKGQFFTPYRDHPRLCGEKRQARPMQSCRVGSPPPMRGKVTVPQKLYLLVRITPAYAGKRPLYFSVVGIKRDHPRLCGEKSPPRTASHSPVGSPPPMRGKADVVLNRIDRIGITPAYAGKRQTSSCPPETVQDHPRLCGEKRNHLYPSLKLTGSPPPMRGKASAPVPPSLTRGITPAYAGKSPPEFHDQG